VLLEAVTVSVATDALTLDLRLTGLSSGDGGDAADGGEPALADARLSSPLAAVPVAQVLPVSGADGEALTRLVFPLAASRWGQPVAPLPAGDYRVRAGGVDVLVDEELLAGCPVAGRTEAHRYSVGRVAGSTRLLVTLAAPLADDEVGRYAQQQLADAYQAADDPPVEAVLLSCYRGEFATDSQRAVHDQLRAQGSALRLRWGVSDCSVVLPEGAERLLIGSREWFTALGSSRYLCQNIDFERYLRLRPHQRYLQTFHGYPFKSMGASLWRTQGRYEAVIASEQRRRSSAWSAIVVPEEFCVEFYRREYGFAGEALVTGYPRNDPLVTADARAVSAQVRHRLGIGPDTTVVLYAPTWRDSAATSAWTAELFTGLDLDALAERLGPDHAVLLRGHNYNLRAGSLGGTDRVLDVSDYPEVNDLVLAADVAVLDYSSLRFDWMLTGKPVLFFVPDLEEYLSSRTVLFDFGPTAPGPLLRTTEELAGALLELDVVDARYAAARQEFNERFNRRHDGHATERLVHAFFP
jgi:CDP-glycerol glycerophosphotransferase